MTAGQLLAVYRDARLEGRMTDAEAIERELLEDTGHPTGTKGMYWVPNWGRLDDVKYARFDARATYLDIGADCPSCRGPERRVWLIHTGDHYKCAILSRSLAFRTRKHAWPASPVIRLRGA